MTTTDRHEGTGRADAPGRPARFVDPQRYPWPPNPARVQVFVLLVLILGGPLTWWAVTR
jgi:hypothetical protein